MSAEGSKLLLGLVDAGKKGFAEFMDFQLHEDMFKGDEPELFSLIHKHATKYAKLPSRKTVKAWGAERRINIPSKDSIVEPVKYYFDKLEKRNLKLDLKAAMMKAENLRISEPKKALSELTSSIITLNQTNTRKQLLNFSQDGGRIIHEEYIRTQLNADKGLKFGWPTFDKMSGGLTGGDVVSIVGRPGLGKTYIALHAMIHAWHQGLSTLFVSMEMKVTPIAQRIAAMATCTSVSELKAAQVATKKYKSMHNVLNSMQDEHGMWIADGALSATVADLQILCSQLQPDVIFIDGAYLLRHPNNRLSRHERINSNVEDCKQHIAEALNIPLIQSFQFNREMTKKADEEAGLEHVAGSDAIGQISSVVMGLFEKDCIETALRRKVRMLKGRNGEQGEFDINWRFGGFGVKQHDSDTDVSDIMNFSEILPEHINTEMKFI